MSEADVMRRLQMAASKLGARLFRQNTGQAWVGKFERGPGMCSLGPNDILIRNARAFHSGHTGMSDLGGWVPVEITPAMVGETVAVYAQVEVKLRTKATREQITWIEAVQSAGGLAGVAHDEEELRKILFPANS